MTSAERDFRLKVIAEWRVQGIERAERDKAEAAAEHAAAPTS